MLSFLLKFQKRAFLVTVKGEQPPSYKCSFFLVMDFYCVRTTLWNSNSVKTGGGGLGIKSCPTLVTPWTVTFQAPLSTGFSRQEYWNGLPFLSPEYLPNPGIELKSPALLTELQGKPMKVGTCQKT